MENTISFLDKVEWWSRWVPVGDALWLPFENMKSAAITDLIGWVKDYIPVKNHNKITEYVELKKWYAPINLDDSGVISDDAILTLAGFYSITEKWKIDISNLFWRHKKMHETYGWYWFSETVDNKLKKYDWSSDLSALQENNTSFGNGVMMKQFPYAAYFYIYGKKYWADDDSMDSTIANITSITHNTPTAKTISVLHNKALIYMFDNQPSEFDMWKLLHTLLIIAPRYDDMYGADWSSDIALRVTPIIDNLVKQWESVQSWNPYTYQQILDTYLVKFSDPKMNKWMKPWYHVASTFGIVYACFMQNMNFQWVIDAITIWQDTDSQWSIVWSMVWALKWPFYEQKYIDWIQKKDEIYSAITGFQNTLESL